jgi:hypothetical protein
MGVACAQRACPTRTEAKPQWGDDIVHRQAEAAAASSIQRPSPPRKLPAAKSAALGDATAHRHIGLGPQDVFGAMDALVNALGAVMHRHSALSISLFSTSFQSLPAIGGAGLDVLAPATVWLRCAARSPITAEVGSAAMITFVAKGSGGNTKRLNSASRITQPTRPSGRDHYRRDRFDTADD